MKKNQSKLTQSNNSEDIDKEMKKLKELEKIRDQSFDLCDKVSKLIKDQRKEFGDMNLNSIALNL